MPKIVKKADQLAIGLIMSSLSIPKTAKMMMPWPKLKAWSMNSTTTKTPASAS